MLITTYSITYKFSRDCFSLRLQLYKIGVWFQKYQDLEFIEVSY